MEARIAIGGMGSPEALTGSRCPCVSDPARDPKPAEDFDRDWPRLGSWLMLDVSCSQTWESVLKGAPDLIAQQERPKGVRRSNGTHSEPGPSEWAKDPILLSAILDRVSA